VFGAICAKPVQIGELTRAVVLSLEAMLTVSPKRQYWGVFSPTKPAATGPECIPDRQQVSVSALSLISLASVN